jgi:hypothetical protein
MRGSLPPCRNQALEIDALRRVGVTADSQPSTSLGARPRERGVGRLAGWASKTTTVEPVTVGMQPGFAERRREVVVADTGAWAGRRRSWLTDTSGRCRPAGSTTLERTLCTGGGDALQCADGCGHGSLGTYALTQTTCATDQLPVPHRFGERLCQASTTASTTSWPASRTPRASATNG